MIHPDLLKFSPKPSPLLNNNSWNVFLSYRSINRAWVLNLYDILIELGHKVFLDQYVIKPGDILIDKLEDALEKSQAGILIWSNEARDSDWVKKEYFVLETKATKDKDFYFIPVRINHVNIPFFANNRIFVDFTAYPDGPNGGDLIRLLHAIVGLPLSPEAIKFSNELDESSEMAFAQVNASTRNGRWERLIELFGQGGLPWETSAALGCKTANGLISLKKYTEAINMLEELEKKFPKSLRPKQLKALALARRRIGKDIEDAQEILGTLNDLNHLDPESLGIYARTWMDRYIASNDINDLKQSRKLYANAFEKSPDDSYTGINAATKSLLIGTDSDVARAYEYADKVQKIVGTSPIPNDYWKTATVAEVMLIKKQYREAGEMYAEAILIEPKSFGSHESTKNQALNLLDKLQANDEERYVVLDPFKHLLI
ncbi:TIR domain-containing protein [Arcicella sp. DC2W]|uniref:TIR domain-containing protein n=1 Tax=Arcicella gelida TaxID=2984195 RepID=A0ABU5SAU0_9BACT|nr:TIR domain-containing protein [Arcicella sp. DC2W]MEA5405606.1 TIR domain-containing protein [Arcicella sp. DC2W]